MSEGPNGIRDSRPGGEGPIRSDRGPEDPQGDPHAWYQRGLELLSRGSPAAAAQILERAATAEPGSRSVREALARAQFDARRYSEAADNFRLTWRPAPPSERRTSARPVAGAVRESRVRRRVPGARRRHAARRAALHQGPARGARYTALPARSRPRRDHRAGGRLSAPAPPASEEPLCRSYDVALLDLDGVVYIGGNAVPGASQALRKAAGEGMRLAYVTNNANRTQAAVASP